MDDVIDVDGASNVVGLIGNFISFGLFLSPLPTFATILRNRDVERFAADPYVAAFLNCALWVLYGLPCVHPGSALVLTVNAVGAAIEAAYLCIYVAHAPRPRWRRVGELRALAAGLAFLGAVAAGVLLGAKTHERRSLVVGSVGVVFGTLMYAAPLTVVRQVVATRSARYMPFMLSLAGFLNAICWTTYAVMRRDVFIAIPNGMGTLLGLAQLILYFCYYENGTTAASSDKALELPVTATASDDGHNTSM
ncbi:hypothetical protein U9M48_040280 [Paspalum notatum var. saurae]|uniref:Bidirectional sugar transporter SWEET n=1 Tax=Paspalum notatum var. saurae TaxID=547442 RepID=A0AAQ3ULR8_PASNO